MTSKLNNKIWPLMAIFKNMLTWSINTHFNFQIWKSTIIYGWNPKKMNLELVTMISDVCVLSGTIGSTYKVVQAKINIDLYNLFQIL